MHSHAMYGSWYPRGWCDTSTYNFFIMGFRVNIYNEFISGTLLRKWWRHLIFQEEMHESSKTNNKVRMVWTVVVILRDRTVWNTICTVVFYLSTIRHFSTKRVLVCQENQTDVRELLICIKKVLSFFRDGWRFYGSYLYSTLEYSYLVRNFAKTQLYHGMESWSILLSVSDNFFWNTQELNFVTSYVWPVPLPDNNWDL